MNHAEHKAMAALKLAVLIGALIIAVIGICLVLGIGEGAELKDALVKSLQVVGIITALAIATIFILNSGDKK